MKMPPMIPLSGVLFLLAGGAADALAPIPDRPARPLPVTGTRL